jgi:hypothetical protein
MDAHAGLRQQANTADRSAYASANEKAAARCYRPKKPVRKTVRHSGAMPTGPASGRPDDKLRIEPGILGFPDVQLHICGLVRNLSSGGAKRRPVGIIPE